MAGASDGFLGELLSHRIIFVAGKGGTGKTSISAALCLLAARAGKRVLGIEVDAKGDLAAALGSKPVGFDPEVVQTNISVLALHPEDSLREYLKVFFKVPKMVGVTPLARIFDFVATSVPGPKDMLTVGKIAYEERREMRGGRPMWDVVVVDCTATGHALAQITAAQEMKKLTRGGMIQGQLEWVDAAIRNPKKTCLVITALPAEMPVVEAVELHRKARRSRGVAVVGCFLNRMPPAALTRAEHGLLTSITSATHRRAVDKRLEGSSESLDAAMEFAATIRTTADRQAAHLTAEMDLPIVEVGLQVAKRGLATSRAIANAIAENAP